MGPIQSPSIGGEDMQFADSARCIGGFIWIVALTGANK